MLPRSWFVDYPDVDEPSMTDPFGASVIGQGYAHDDPTKWRGSAMAAADAVSLIERDHRAMEKLFKKVSSGAGNRAELVDEIAVRLAAHARAEEQEVYPAAKQADAPQDEEVEHAYDEHREAEHLLRSARNLTESPHFEEAFQAFVAAVEHHVREEEREVLPALRAAVDAAALRRLGAAFEQTRQALVADPAALLEAMDASAVVKRDPVRTVKPAKRANGAGQRRSSKNAGNVGKAKAAKGVSVPDATRDELYEMARAAGLPGRSAMNKQELAEALRRHS
jgi:hemerythrin superfamily protein